MSASSFAAVSAAVRRLLLALIVLLIALPASAHVPRRSVLDVIDVIDAPRELAAAPPIGDVAIEFQPIDLYDGPTSFSVFTSADKRGSGPCCAQGGGEALQNLMHARYYDPNKGRFLSVDPVLNLKRALREPQNWNRYAYVMNNPLKYTDPTGKDVSIRLNFTGDGWTDEEKKKVIAQVTSWYQNQKVGKVFVFDGAKASHGGNFLTRMFSGGYTSIGVSSGTGTKHTPSTVFAGNYSSLSPQQRIRAISNSIIHETAAHHFGATAGHNADQMFYARDSGYRMWPDVRARYGTVADSYSYADPITRGNVTNGPIPIHPGDLKTLQDRLGEEHVEPPDYDN